ncbi:MAG: relaxase/mobilization nuclease domain-containing protein [Anditalea sp.]
MIAKQSIRSSFMGALGYNLKKMHHADKTERAELLATNFISLEKSVIKKEVDLVASLNPQLKRNTYHTSLNFAPGEKVSDEKMLTVAEEYMERIGFDNNPYFIFRHHDSNHPHCHILALRTRFDGTTVSDSNNYRRSEEIVRQLERKYGLQQAAGSGRSAFRAPDKDELEMVQRTGKASRKMVLQEKVSSALSKSKNLKEFITHLEKAGVQVLFNQASTGRVSGISFFTGDFKAKGQALGNRFKWANIIKALDYEQTRDRKEISQANSRTRAKYGEGQTGRSTGHQPDSRHIGNNHEEPADPEQTPTYPGGRNQKESCPFGQLGETDDGHGEYHNEPGEAAAENTETADDHLLYGHHTPAGFHHGAGLKDLDIEIVPEEENDRRRRKRRYR